MSSLPCIFPELLTTMDCFLVLRSDETVFGAGRNLRLHSFPSGPCPVIPLHLLQQGLPSGVQLSVGTPDSPTDAAVYSLPRLVGPPFSRECPFIWHHRILVPCCSTCCLMRRIVVTIAVLGESHRIGIASLATAFCVYVES